MVRDLPKAADGILSYFTRHGTAANLLLVVLIIAGLVSLPRMRAQFFPDVIIDNVTVSVAWRGAARAQKMLMMRLCNCLNLPCFLLKV